MNERISRRDMLKIAAGVGGVTLFTYNPITRVLYNFLRYQGTVDDAQALDTLLHTTQTPDSIAPRHTNQVSPTAFQPRQEQATPYPDPTEPTATATSEPLTHRFGNIDLSFRGEDIPKHPTLESLREFVFARSPKTDMTFKIHGQEITSMVFHPFSWFPGIEDTRLFEPNHLVNTAISWADTDGRTGLWVHSGMLGTTPMTMWPIQRAFEMSTVLRRTSEEVQLFLEDLVGSDACIYQDSESNRMTQRALLRTAIRIPPKYAVESDQHIMDMASWTSDVIDRSFGKTLATISPDKTIMIRFCGRQLSGETPTPNVPDALQARFILALEAL